MDHYEPISDELDKRFNASLGFFFDDGALGSGDALDPDASEMFGSGDAEEEEKGFDQHLAALDFVFRRAAEINMRFKLSKCSFAQFAVPILGEVAGCGLVAPDPAKTEAIRNWPRPSKEEDVETFLCTFGFFRTYISPRFSAVAAPLRACMSALHEKRAAGKYRKKSVAGIQKNGCWARIVIGLHSGLMIAKLPSMS